MNNTSINKKVILGDAPTPDEVRKARLAVCARSKSPEEASRILKMLGLLERV